MAIREIVLIGNPVLRKKAKKVEKITPLELQLMDDMAETMYAAPGIGLAAPQIGVSKRIIVVDVGDGLHKLINPKITHKEGTEVTTEGCLSIPGLVGDVERAARVIVKAMNQEGRIVKIDAEGILATCLQHEIDHLDGILYVDKATNIREPEPSSTPEEQEDSKEEIDRENAGEEEAIEDAIEKKEDITEEAVSLSNDSDLPQKEKTKGAEVRL